MTNYCLEHSTNASENPILHKLECTSYDLGSLLGDGRLANLGDFDNSFAALDFVRNRHPGAIRCVDCCRADLAMPLYVWRSSTRDFVVAEVS